LSGLGVQPWTVIALRIQVKFWHGWH
jgi:hypothetical protein